MRCIFFTFSNSFPIFQYKTFFPYKHSFFFLSGFSSQTLTIHRTATLQSTRSRTLRHLLATLHVRWISRIFNRNACVYQTATRWDLPPYRITIWVINWLCNVCLFTWWIDTRFLLQQFDFGNQWIWTRIDYHPFANRLTKCTFCEKHKYFFKKNSFST